MLSNYVFIAVIPKGRNDASSLNSVLSSVFICSHVTPVASASLMIDHFQVGLGLPNFSFLEDSNQVSAIWTLQVPLFSIPSDIGICLSLSHKLTVDIFSGDLILNIQRRKLFSKFWGFNIGFCNSLCLETKKKYRLKACAIDWKVEKANLELLLPFPVLPSVCVYIYRSRRFPKAQEMEVKIKCKSFVFFLLSCLNLKLAIKFLDLDNFQSHSIFLSFYGAIDMTHMLIIPMHVYIPKFLYPY